MTTKTQERRALNDIKRKVREIMGGEAGEPEDRVRCRVAMSNGFACDGQGYAAECARPAT